MSKGAIPWKGTIVRAASNVSVKTDLLKLARNCYKAAKDNEPDTLVKDWMARAQETVAWALSNEAGEAQIMAIEDVPPSWVAAVGEIRDSFKAGVDMTKIPSYHQMKKIRNMLNKEAGIEDEAPAVPDSEADKLNKEIEAAEDALNAAKDKQRDAKASEEADAKAAEAAQLEAANDEDGDVPIVEDEDGEGEQPADLIGPDPIPGADEHENEPEKGKEPIKGPSTKPVEIDADTRISNEDAAFAAAVLQAALKSGQVLDPKNIVMCPVYLLQIVKMLDKLTEGKRNQLVKGINTLVVAQYDNHLNEIAEGKARTKTQKQKALEAEQKRAAKGHAEVIQLSDKQKKAAAKKKAADTKPPTRSKGDADVFADQFADLMGTKK